MSPAALLERDELNPLAMMKSKLTFKDASAARLQAFGCIQEQFCHLSVIAWLQTRHMLQHTAQGGHAAKGSSSISPPT